MNDLVSVVKRDWDCPSSLVKVVSVNIADAFECVQLLSMLLDAVFFRGGAFYFSVVVLFVLVVFVFGLFLTAGAGKLSVV